MKNKVKIKAVSHENLDSLLLSSLQRLFDDEYLEDYGSWNPDLPYGYSSHDVHIVAFSEDSVVGHMGWQRRVIQVGEQTVTIAGIGGVLVSESARGHRLGQRLMGTLLDSIHDSLGIDFAYLGCKEEVVAFYESCGFTRICQAEKWINQRGNLVSEEAGSPLLIYPVLSDLQKWPTGVINLQGRSW